VKFLVDANVLSEPTKPSPAQAVLDWLAKNDHELAVSPIVLGELEYGINLLPAGAKRTKLRSWFTAGMRRLANLDLDAETASFWAELMADLARKGKAMPIKDSLIAATARQHRLTVVTRNTSDYKHAGVSLIDPFRV
jgi:predicted nucleic acid-binding protein